MKKQITTFICLLLFSLNQSIGQTSFTLFNNEMFFGGYASLSDWQKDTIAGMPESAGLKRLKTSLLSRKFTNEQLSQIGNNLSAKVTVKAACDNYDRGAHLVLALIKKGDTSYSNPQRFEIGRFITPFMDKNKMPDTVPYLFELNNIAMLLKEKSIRDSFDVWCEFEIFGTPGAAWNEIKGCGSGSSDGNGKPYPNRRDVFYGTVEFTSSGSNASETNNIYIPLANKFNINMKKAGQSDSIGLPQKTFTFNLPVKSYYTRAFLITSSHGAGNGGEEYNRREHKIFVDGSLAYEYLPGESTCEPYRKYNTQANGIYGANPKSESQWQSFSNWCPGAVVPVRIINLGILEAGSHTIKVAIPDAQFPNSDDKIETSLFIQGKNEPFTGINEQNETITDVIIYPNPAHNFVHIESASPVKHVSVYNLTGLKIIQSNNSAIDITNLDCGVYYIKIVLNTGFVIVQPLLKN